MPMPSPVTDDPQPQTDAQAHPGTILDAVQAGVAFETETHDSLTQVDAIVDVENFSLWYGPSRALFEVGLRVPRHGVTALIGPSGCGKSTLLRSINRLNDLVDRVRTDGQMYLNSSPVYAPDVDVIELRKRLGMVFQKPNPFPMSIYENVVFPLRIDGENRRGLLHEACERALKSAALWDEVKDRLRSSALRLSGGQQQRLCIARAIVADPEVLLLDEPCSALDPLSTLRIEELIQDISRRYTVIMVTHNMQQAARVSQNTAFMYLGRLVEYGPTDAIFQTPHLPETEQYVSGRFG
jgi:phosphate transport system ATP-binding protein